jgi:hypothetical protein
MFPRIDFEQEVTYEDSRPNFRSDFSILETLFETWFLIPQEDLSKTHWITHAYKKLLGNLPIAF